MRLADKVVDLLENHPDEWEAEWYFHWNGGKPLELTHRKSGIKLQKRGKMVLVSMSGERGRVEFEAMRDRVCVLRAYQFVAKCIGERQKVKRLEESEELRQKIEDRLEERNGGI